MVEHIFIAGRWIRNMYERVDNGRMYECVSCCAAFWGIGDDHNDDRTGGSWLVLGFFSTLFGHAFLVAFLIILNLKYYIIIGLIVLVEFFLNLDGLLNLHFASPYIEKSEVSTKKPIGRLNKFLIDIFALGIVILLQYSFECVWQCVAWILFVVEFQVILKLKYGSHDLVFSDVFVGVIMRLLVIYQKENDVSRMIVNVALCILIIYHMHRSFITTATAISSKAEEGSEIKDIEAVITIETNS